MGDHSSIPTQLLEYNAVVGGGTLKKRRVQFVGSLVLTVTIVNWIYFSIPCTDLDKYYYQMTCYVLVGTCN